MPIETRFRRALRLLFALSMVTVGVLHLVAPDGFVTIVPRWLPAPLLLVVVSGLCEIVLGLGLLVRRAHRLAALLLIGLFVAVFPANVTMAVHDLQPFAFVHVTPLAQWLRLPFQGVFIAIAWWLSRSPVQP
jgi:uncharacterized membrane protein